VSPAPSGWAVERFRGSAGDFHARDLPRPVARTVWCFDVERTTLVLGSTQPDADVDRAALHAADVDLVRRRSGGGAVLLVPGQVAWVDVVLPPGDPLWSDDVGRAFHWIGDAWAVALGSFGPGAVVHRGPMIPSRWSRLICFAGLGPGEVLVDGRKAVGLSQRRTRDGVRLQGAVHHRFDPAALVGLLALDSENRAAVIAELSASVATVDAPVPAIERAFLAALPA
jgi:lipoate-protein ligase A